ncbi:MAG: CCA tRNA nucleotidyltransferase, partial [Alphaproteobacteria bacterium]
KKSYFVPIIFEKNIKTVNNTPEDKKIRKIEMIRDNYLDVKKIVQDKKFLKLFRVVESHGGVLRFVGGAVRDALAGLKGFDIDLATDLSPDELVEACTENGIKTVPIGIKFGTVGVIINDQVLEVTSLRKDIKTDGRHAEVVFTTDWEADASRRDLTINAVYADEKGNVFDYYNGIEDLEKGIVRFIGLPAQRIKEDYLRIMRFFRFYSIFGKTEIDKKALKACIENRDGLKNLSLERIRDELFKILLTKNVSKTIRIMFDNEILSYLLPDSKNLDKLDFLINMVAEEGLRPNPVRRLFMLYLPDKMLAENLASRLRLTKKQKEEFINWATIHPQLSEFMNEESLLVLIYKYGKDFCQNKLLLLQAAQMNKIPHLSETLKFINDAIVPIFPVKGKDIINAGVQNHHNIGIILDELQEIWIKDNFSATRDELLQIAAELVKSKSA